VRRVWLRLPQPLASYDLEAAAAAGGLATAYYAALTGFAVPAQRSLLMIVVALGLLLRRRSVGLLQGLAAALLAVLIFDPFAPLGASFWLSFVAVAVVLVLAAPRRVRATRGSARLAHGAAAVAGLQWSIGLALLPLTAYLFAEVSLLGPLVNLVAIPLFNLVLVPLTLLATLACSFDLLAPGLGILLIHGVGWLASHTVAILHALGELPVAALSVPAPPPITLWLAALGVAFALPAHPLPGRRLAWLAVLPMFVALPRPPPLGAARIVVLDVGHGLAVIVETNAHRLLFDAGPTFPSGFDSGEEVVVPALHASGRRGLDRLIVSHSDNDHAGGAAAVLAAFPRADVLHGPDVAALGGRRCERGEEWQWDGVRFLVLHPPAEFAARGNESSCVLKIAAAGGSVLLTGDIERRGETAVEGLADLRADVVVVPHHGSATSSSAGLVRAVAADYAIVSAGHANRWGFPKPVVRARWEDAGAAVLVTGDSGAITVDVAAGITVLTERDGRHRYWQSSVPSAAKP
jgi:competence protein ComEC